MALEKAEIRRQEAKEDIIASKYTDIYRKSFVNYTESIKS